MSESSSEKCQVCLDKFTSVVRAKVKCPYCPAVTCKSCLQRFLLSTPNDPHCMSCNREWNMEFIDITFTPTFRKGPLKEHRRKVLVEREVAILPSMQTYVEATYLRDKAWKAYKESQQEADKLLIEKNRLERTINHSIPNPSPELDALISKVGNLVKANYECTLRARLQYDIYNRQIAYLEGRDIGQRNVRQFIMKCPGASALGEPCRGFLSSQWKCGTCQKFFCADCHALLGDTREVPHTCNEDAKATAALIKKDTRPCPKCGIRISKIDGCDQMWCVSCQTAFSWNTGQIVNNTRIHNPHYYEYLRQTGGTMPREAGDVPCGGFPDYYLLLRNLRNYRTRGAGHIANSIELIHRRLLDIQEVRIPDHPLRRPANDNRDLDVAYLMNHMTKEEWARQLQLKETKFERKKEIGLILQTLSHVGAEKLTEILNLSAVQGNEERLFAIVQELEALRNFTNDALRKRGELMGVVVPQIVGPEWHWEYTKRKGAATAATPQGEAPPPAPPNQV